MSRAERRRESRDDQQRIARGLDVTARDGREIVALMRVLHERARDAIAERSVAPLMAFLYENVALAERRIAGAGAACRKGCAHCLPHLRKRVGA